MENKIDAQIANKVEMYEHGMSRKEAKDILRGQLREKCGVIILKSKNDNDEIRLNMTSVGKLLSVDAVNHSTKNGFTEKQHFAVVSDIVNLFGNSVKVLTRPDRDGNLDMTIHQFAAPLHFKDAIAYFMAKESRIHGKRIYTAELMKIKKLGGMLADEGIPNELPPAPSFNDKAPGPPGKEGGNTLSPSPSMRLYNSNISDLIAKVK